MFDDAGTSAVGKGGPSAGGSGGNGGAAVGSTDNALTVHVEDEKHLTIHIVTVRCSDDCADVVAVAEHGNPPYAFKWNDGSTNAMRHVCPNANAEYSVQATDTAIHGDEFGHVTQTASAKVTAPGVLLPDWSVCTGSPDVNPIFATAPATDGATYLDMVAGNIGGNGDLVKTASGAFCQPPSAAQPTSFTVDDNSRAAPSCQ